MSNENTGHLVVYGIKTCDGCRNTQKWLKARNTEFTFHDFRTDGLPEGKLKAWLNSDRGSLLVNRRSTSWRKLTDEEKQSAEVDPLPLLIANPTLIKRPVITKGNILLAVGFSPDKLEKLI